MTRIVLKNIVKNIRGKNIFNDLNLEIESREVTVFLGPVGAGKTTLFKIIAGTESVDSGKIYFDDVEVTKLPPQKRDVAMVFQNFALYPHLSIFENIASPLRVKKYHENEIKKRVNEIAELLNIKHILDKKPHECSGGEAQRASIARALAKNPKIYLFDEPLTNLDYKVREVLRFELKKLFKEVGATVLYSTSNPEEAAALGSRLAYIRNGQVLQTGAVLDCFRKPFDIDAASHYSLFGINLFEGYCKIIDSRKFLVIDDLFEVDVSDHKFLESGNEYFIGIYPHDLKLRKSSNEDIQIPISVDFLENMGSELIVVARSGNFIVRLLVSGLENLSELMNLTSAYVPLSRLLIFSKENRKLLKGDMPLGRNTN